MRDKCRLNLDVGDAPATYICDSFGFDSHRGTVRSTRETRVVDDDLDPSKVRRG